MPETWPFLIPGFGSPESRGRARFFGLGEARLIILSLLDEAPGHGYQLMKEMRRRLGELYSSSAGTVYPALKQLQKEGLIESSLKEGRHVYRLTREGRKLVRAEESSIQQIWSRASDYEGLGRQLGPHTSIVASPLQEVIAAGLLAARWSSGDPDREDRVRSILRDTASQLRALARNERKKE